MVKEKKYVCNMTLSPQSVPSLGRAKEAFQLGLLRNWRTVLGLLSFLHGALL